MNRYQGGCLCGACRYVIATGQKPKAMYLCHCSRCRKELAQRMALTFSLMMLNYCGSRAKRISPISSWKIQERTCILQDLWLPAS